MATAVLRVISLAITIHCVLSCCGPEKWEALQGVTSGLMINGVGGKGQGLIRYYLDAVSNKVAVIGQSMYNNQPVKQHVLYDVGHGMRYESYNGQCTKHSMVVPSFKINCLPSDAKKLLSTYYGTGDEKFAFDMYEFTSFTGEKMTMSLTKGSCVPLGGQVTQSNGFSDFGFMNITLGIKDMSVFDVPKECLTLMKMLS